MPHFQIKVIFWMIQIDSWGSNDLINVTLNSMSLNYTSSNKRDSIYRVQSSYVCGTSNKTENYWRYEGNFNQNDSSPYEITITTNNSGSKWGIK